VFQPPSGGGAVHTLHLQIRGRHGTPAHGYLSRNAREIHLRFDAEYTLDGEMRTADSRQGPVVLTDGGRACFVRC